LEPTQGFKQLARLKNIYKSGVFNSKRFQSSLKKDPKNPTTPNQNPTVSIALQIILKILKDISN